MGFTPQREVSFFPLGNLEGLADVIETDLPREVGKLLYGESAITAGKSEFFSEAAGRVVAH